MDNPIRVFVGCAKEHRLAFRVLRHSIESQTERPVEVFPLNNADATRPDDWWRDDELFGKYKPIHIPTPADRSQRGATTFSFQRFLIPELCGFEGRGIYLDSDQLVLGDIAEFWDHPMLPGASVLKPPGWQSAVMMIDCEVGAWSIAKLIRQIDQGKRTYKRMMNLHDMGFLDSRLQPEWNTQDRDQRSLDEFKLSGARAKLLHFTDMRTQPWLRVDHPWGVIWGNALLEAIAEGVVSRDDVRKAIDDGDVRPSLALLIGDQPKYPDHAFVYPDERSKGKGLHR